MEAWKYVCIEAATQNTKRKGAYNRFKGKGGDMIYRDIELTITDAVCTLSNHTHTK